MNQKQYVQLPGEDVQYDSLPGVSSIGRPPMMWPRPQPAPARNQVLRLPESPELSGEQNQFQNLPRFAPLPPPVDQEFVNEAIEQEKKAKEQLQQLGKNLQSLSKSKALVQKTKTRNLLQALVVIFSLLAFGFLMLHFTLGRAPAANNASQIAFVATATVLVVATLVTSVVLIWYAKQTCNALPLQR